MILVNDLRLSAVVANNGYGIVLEKMLRESSIVKHNCKGTIPMLEDFLTKADKLRNEYLLKTEALFVSNKQAWFAAFAEHFLNVCNEIQKLQAESALSAISYLEYTMLHANFINRQYIAEVCVYGDESYLDKRQCIVGSYDVSFLFVYFDKLWDELLSLRKRFVGQVSSLDVTECMMNVLPDFYSYLASIARFAVAECLDKKQFTGIIKNEEFSVNVGDYMAATETIYTENKDKDAGKLAKWFYKQIENAYSFGDYSGLDFSGCIFKHTDFRYASFRNSSLKDASLAGSSLEGASFRKASMEGCVLDNCTIFEADFSNAVLKNASFVNVQAKAGLPDEEDWEFVGFLPVSFRNADLTNANFTGANLKGADFSGAVLSGTDFTNVVLDGAIFDDTLAKVAVLDETIFSGVISGKAEFMRYYVMEPLGNTVLPAAPKGENAEVVKVSGVSQFSEIDYDSRSELISDRLKLLMEMYLPKYDFEPVVYLDQPKGEQMVFWRFRPPHYDNYQATYRSDGIISHITFLDNNAPVMFTARSPKGICSIVVRMAVAESALRRGFLGVKFTKVLE
jgi:uncharacterized protein YjbI with pentapeptide repeats